MTTPNAITVAGLRRTYRVRREKGLLRGIFHPDYEEIRAVDGISFTVARGEAVALLGPNGAGKTTTMKMLTGLVLPTGGTVSVLGYTPFDRKTEFLRRIGLVMGNKAGLNWDLTARQSFELFRRIYRIDTETFVARLNELTEMLEVAYLLDRQVRRLSLGERMKMELIGAILHAPDVLFLDEPTIGLDITAKRNIRTFLKELPTRLGTTLVLTSHDMDDIEEVCARVIVVTGGHIVHDGPLPALVRAYQRERFIRLTFAEDAPAPVVPPYATPIEDAGSGRVFRVSEAQFVAFLGIATQLPGLLDLHIESVPLEQIIADLFTRKRHG